MLAKSLTYNLLLWFMLPCLEKQPCLVDKPHERWHFSMEQHLYTWAHTSFTDVRLSSFSPAKNPVWLGIDMKGNLYTASPVLG